MQSVMKLGIKGKLAPRYIGPFEVIERIGEVAYCLNLLPPLGFVHNVFHVSMFKKYTSNSSHILPYTEIPLQVDISNKEQLEEILVKIIMKVLRLHNREVPLIKVHWQNHNEDKATSELKFEMYEKYTYMFGID